MKLLVSAGARVRATDPEAMGPAKVQLQSATISVELIADEYAACTGADALVIATEWPEYRNPDFARIRAEMRGRQIYDGRNILQSDAVVEAGFAYFAIGRPDAMPKTA